MSRDLPCTICEGEGFIYSGPGWFAPAEKLVCPACEGTTVLTDRAIRAIAAAVVDAEVDGDQVKVGNAATFQAVPLLSLLKASAMDWRSES